MQFRMFSVLKATALVALLGLAGSQANAQVGYKLDVTTEYLFFPSLPAGATFLGGGVASPDTAYFVITNNGASTFTGTIGDLAVSSGGTDYSFSMPVILAPGASDSVAIGPEASNAGGFNGPFGSVQPGVQILLNGAITNGGSEAVSLSVSDPSIHSGVFQTNVFGVTLDNYVLQGGDPLGRDNGDTFELAQAFGHFEFFQAAVPEPGSVALLVGLGAVGAGVFARRRRK
jgi:hypothetical protein